MKILQVVKTNIGANWAFTQAKWLAEHGVDIVTVLPSLKGGMAEKYQLNGLKVIKGDFALPINEPWKLIRRIREINHIVNDVNPDIIHCHFVTNIMMMRLALKKSNIPRLFQVPGPLHLESKLFKKGEMILSNNNDFWAGACKKTCDIYIKSGIPQGKVFLAYYGGYGGKACDEYKEETNILHDDYKLTSDKILVGMVSYFYKPKAHLMHTRGLKGHEDFIDAIALVRKRHPEVIGVIIGDAWGNSHNYVEKVKRYAHKKCKDGIIFTGFRNDMKDIYKELDIAVHPSHSENLGGAAEYFAAGVPTISTNIGGFPDIVIDNVTGYTVDIKSPEKLSETIISMILNYEDARNMALVGQSKIREMLDIENTAKNIYDIYHSIIQERNY